MPTYCEPCPGKTNAMFSRLDRHGHVDRSSSRPRRPLRKYSRCLLEAPRSHGIPAYPERAYNSANRMSSDGDFTQNDAEATVQTLDVMIARLRLMLADIGGKQSQLENLRRQYREQHKRIISSSLYSETSLETTLGLLRDVSERQRDVDETLEQLALVRRKAESELESLQLTRGVDQARAALAELKRRQADAEDGALPTTDELQEEIRRLQNLINDASDRAARSIERR